MTVVERPTVTAVPRWSTPRSPERPTFGGDVARVAALLRRPLTPWQRALADVSGEVIAPGRFAYPIVVVVVPRRAGKTISTLATLLERVQLTAMARGWYTAQRREDAAKMFRDEWSPLVEMSPIGAALKTRKAQGSEGFTFRESRSTVQLFAPTRSALHSTNADTVVVDEAWYFDLATGDDIEAGARPAQLTRQWRQTWIVSAGGTELSTYLDKWMTTGRAGVDAGRRDGVCYLEFSADPSASGYDPTDPAVWRATHPGVGFNIDAQAIAEDLATMDLAAFERSILNVWPRPSEGRVTVIDAALWAARAVPAARPGAPVAFALDVAPDRAGSSIAVAGRAHSGAVTVVEVIDRRAGTGWLLPALRELRADFPGAPIAADSLVAASVIADARRSGFDIIDVGASDLARACGAFVDLLDDGRLIHRGQTMLDDALAGAGRRNLADAWAWSRNRSAVDVSPLVAVTLAAWALLSTPQGKPDVGVS